jgi:galactokinase
MDQTIVERGLKGHALLLDCGRDVAVPIPLSGESVAVIAIHCGVAHELAQGAYAQRREECAKAAKMIGVSTLRDAMLDALESLKSDDTLYRRARHVVTENGRVQLAIAAIKNGDWPMLGRLMVDSHMSLKEDYAVSCDELDLLVDMALTESGVYGARMTGGGFGGCMIVLVDRARAEAVAGSICSRYGAQTGREPLCYQVDSAAGASELCAVL